MQPNLFCLDLDISNQSCLNQIQGLRGGNYTETKIHRTNLNQLAIQLRRESGKLSDQRGGGIINYMTNTATGPPVSQWRYNTLLIKY